MELRKKKLFMCKDNRKCGTAGVSYIIANDVKDIRECHEKEMSCFIHHCILHTVSAWDVVNIQYKPLSELIN